MEFDPQLFMLRNCIRALGMETKDYQECEHARYSLFRALERRNQDMATTWTIALRIALVAARNNPSLTVQQRNILQQAETALNTIVSGIAKMGKENKQPKDVDGNR